MSKNLFILVGVCYGVVGLAYLAEVRVGSVPDSVGLTYNSKTRVFLCHEEDPMPIIHWKRN